MSRAQNDTVIDDDEETCPLCIEEFDLSDKNFKPCPCGYQICQFCFNSLKTTYEKSTCPNCRRVYDEKTIQYKIPTAEEFKLDQQNKNKKQAAAKRKETEKREVETSNRRNLAGVRVKQQNLVYVIGLVPSIKDENALLQTLRGNDYFGQYGEIEKIVVSKAKPGAINQGIGVYVTYTTKEAAATCITTVDGSMNGDRVLRAQFGTTKYCSAYLRGEVCNNKSCSFLHETGEDGQTTTIQNEPMPAKPPQRPPHTTQSSQAQPPPPPKQPQAVPPSTASSTSSSQPMVRQSSKDEPNSRKGSTDGSALPSSVSWANSNAPVTRARRTSQAASRSSPSPQITPAVVATQKQEEPTPKESDAASPAAPSQAQPIPSVPSTVKTEFSQTPASPKPIRKSPKPQDALLAELVASVNSPDFRFVFDDSLFSAEDLAAIERHPTMIDMYGGAKRRVMREKEAERAKLELEAQAKVLAQAAAEDQPTETEEVIEDEPFESGSLALGGEPEDNPRSGSARGAIGRPSQQSSTGNFINDQFSGLNARSLTPQQRQHLAQLTSSNIQQAPGLGQPSGHPFSAGAFDHDQRSSAFQGQPQYEPSHGHARHHSRFNFANDSSKPNSARFPSQQQGPGSQHFYTSGVQGPPPGLKTAGTPPISGGGMFAQGHGFTSNMNAGFGNVKDANTDMLMRGRSSTNTGHDISKREYLLSLQNTNLRSPPPSAPAPGLLNSLYGQYAGAYQDPGLVKQKKKGKKHRHANTSSSGGGVVDLADPSILQARLHQSNTGAGQGPFNGQNQDDQDFPPLAPIPRLLEFANPLRSGIHSIRSSQDSTARSSTPKIPPGLNIPLLQPSGDHAHDVALPPISLKPAVATPGPINPAVPVLPLGQRASTPKVKTKDASTPDVKSATSAKQEESISAQSDSRPSAAQKMHEDVSFGSPAPKSVVLNKEPTTDHKAELSPNKEGEVITPAVTEASVVAEKSTTQRRPGVPMKLDTARAINATSPSMPSSAKDQTPLLGNSIVATPPAISRPSTPATVASKASESSVIRPRTLRVTTPKSQKPDTAPASASTEKSIILPPTMVKQSSRQPSVSSISRSRPSTPAVSDLMFSNDVSRANSPPPSIVGSAPERTKTKNQMRKERKSKARESTTETPPEGPPTPAERKVEEVAPIVSRQKKKRRTQDRSTIDDSTSDAGAVERSETKRPATPEPPKVSKPEIVKDVPAVQASDKGNSDVSAITAENASEAKKKGQAPAVKKEEKAVPSTTPKDPYTLNQLYLDASKAKDPEAFQKLLDEHISNVQTLFSQLFESRDLDQSSALFNLPPLSSYRLPPDSRKGADYLDGNGYTMSSPFGEVYVTSKERRSLQQGSAVRISDLNRPADLLRRTMITSQGRVYRHLTQEEEEKVLEIERRQDEDELKYGELGVVGVSKVDESDFPNIEGGLEELFRYGVRHGVSWVTDGKDGDGTMDDEDDADWPSDDDQPGELADLAGGWQTASQLGTMPPSVTSAKDHAATRHEMPKKMPNLRAMDIEQLQRTIRETQAEVEQARREMEAMEKKWAKKGKEAAKWRESILKGKAMVGLE